MGAWKASCPGRLGILEIGRGHWAAPSGSRLFKNLYSADLCLDFLSCEVEVTTHLILCTESSRQLLLQF